MAEASEWINTSDTICHYKRFFGFSQPNYNGCHAGDSKMVELLHLFAENRLIHFFQYFAHISAPGALPATTGSNGTVGIAFGDEANAGKAGQRAQNPIVAQPGTRH